MPESELRALSPVLTLSEADPVADPESVPERGLVGVAVGGNEVGVVLVMHKCQRQRPRPYCNRRAGGMQPTRSEGQGARRVEVKANKGRRERNEEGNEAGTDEW